MSTKDSPDGQKRPSFIEAARKAQLIECAIEIIATLGYAQASLAQIAQRAGVSKGVVTYYFSNKEELIGQVVSAIYTEAAAYIGPRVAAHTAFAPRLRAYIEAHVEYISAHLQQMMAIIEIASNMRTSGGKLRYGVGAAPAVRAALEALLRKGQQAGEFRDFDARVMAVAIRGAIDALPPLLIADPQMDAGQYAREVGDLFDRATRAV